MISNRNILVTGLQGIDTKMGSNAVNLAYEFSKHNKVLYVNYPLDRFTAWKYKANPEIRKRIDIIHGKSSDLIEIKANLWTLYPKTILESISQIRNVNLFNFFNRINNRRFISKIKEALGKLGFSDVLWFNDSDFYRVFFLIDVIKPAVSLYYSRDNMIATDYFRLHGARMEGLLMKKFDAVVTNSIYLQEEALKFNESSFYVGQGCDVTAFDKRLVKHIPEDIARITKPIVGYIGALIKLRLDIDLIEFLVKGKPEWNFVFVGPEDEIFTRSNLHNFPNVHFLGSKNQSLLPAYLAHFDIAINPQAINEITIGNYPRKIDEYLAMGKPVVATNTGAMKVFKEFVYLAHSYPEFLSLLQKAFDENSETIEEAREQFARGHTWEVNAKEIYNVMELILDKNQQH